MTYSIQTLAIRLKGEKALAATLLVPVTGSFRQASNGVVQVRRLFSLALAAGTVMWLAGCQATGSIGNRLSAPDGAVQFAGTQTNSVTEAVHRMPTGQHVVPPYGYIGFCLRNAHECEGGTDTPHYAGLTPARWSELNQVNDFVNSSIRQVEDAENYDRAEWWAYPNERGGDCEDIVLLKRKMLIERGWPAEALLLTVAREWNGDGHALLTVTTDKGDYILDNKNWQIVSWEKAPYAWIKRQSRERPYVWVNLDQGSFRLAANEKLPPLGTMPPFLAAVAKPAGKSGLRPTISEEPAPASTRTAAIAAR